MLIQIDKALQKKQELEFYRNELKTLEARAASIQRNITTTRDVIKIIQAESIIGDTNV